MMRLPSHTIILAIASSTQLPMCLRWRLPVCVTITLLIAMEVFVGYWIHDNLTLNIIMLLYPFEAILEWQRGG